MIMQPERPCQHCGALFSPAPRSGRPAKFCSPMCRADYTSDYKSRYRNNPSFRAQIKRTKQSAACRAERAARQASRAAEYQRVRRRTDPTYAAASRQYQAEYRANRIRKILQST